MPSLTERFMGRPFRDTEWWIWWLFLPLLLYAWPLVLLFLLGRFALDMIGYAPSERRLKAIGSSTHNTHAPVGDVYIPVGPEHNRPESEWWDLEGKNEVKEEIAREQVLAERLVYSLTFLAVFAGTYALEESFWISVIVTTGFVVGSWALNRGGFSPWMFFPPL